MNSLSPVSPKYIRTQKMTLPLIINLIWKDKEQVADARLEETTTRTRLTNCCQTAIKTRLSTIVFRREDRANII